MGRNNCCCCLLVDVIGEEGALVVVFGVLGGGGGMWVASMPKLSSSELFTIHCAYIREIRSLNP